MSSTSGGIGVGWYSKNRSEDYGLRCKDEVFSEDFHEDYEKRAKITKNTNRHHSLRFLVLFCRF